MTPTVYVAQTTTGVILDELDGATAQITDDIAGNNITGRFAIPMKRDLRSLLEPWRHSLVVAEPGRMWWAGPITENPTRQRSDQSHIVQASAGSVWSVLDQRPSWIAGQAPPTEDADLVARMRSWRGLAVALLDCGLSYGALPIALARNDLEGNLDREWPSYTMESAAKALRDLKVGDADSDRVEVHFEPRWVDQRDNKIEWLARIGNPTITGRRQTWDAGSDALRAIPDASSGERLATHAWVGGAGQERARIVGAASADAKIGQGWPALHSIDASGGSSLEDATTARQLAEADVRRTDGLSIQPVVDPDGAPKNGHPTAPVFGQWHLGDRARIDVSGDDWIPDGSHEGRITSWSYSTAKHEMALGLSGDLQPLTAADIAYTP